MSSDKFFKEVKAGVVGAASGAVGAAAGKTVGSAAVGHMVTTAATQAVVCAVPGIAPEVASAMGVVAAMNVTAPTTAAGLTAVTATGVEGGLCLTTAGIGAKAGCGAAATKFSAVAWVGSTTMFGFAAIAGVAGYYCYKKFDEIGTEVEKNKAESDARFANLERMLNARSQIHIHNLDSMEHDALIDLLTCPITLELINDPVYMNDERFYERSAITQYYSSGNRRSPVRQDVTLDNPSSITTHAQVRNFLETNRERLLSDPPPSAPKGMSFGRK